jgi:predicted ATP-grasp superfamily ATP-dependent carboligase
VRNPSELYTLDREVEVPRGTVMLEALDGFVDAGSAVKLAREHLLETLESTVVARFDVDALLDYRSRRPVMVFDRDHWESYDEPSLALHLLRDSAGTEFLMLAGPEPDLQWERFAAAVVALVEELDVRLTAQMHAIPMAVPHTRPFGMTRHATNPELLVGVEPWFQTVQVPGSAAALLQFRLGQAGRDATGFALHVPQYLVSAELPDAAAALIDSVAVATGLTIPDAALLEAGEKTRAEIDAQVGRSEEVTAVVRGLEQQYDAFVRGRAGDLLTGGGGEELPTGDEIGAELERFLAEHSGEPPQG